GLTIDNLIEADVVLADGTFVTANVQTHPDLFWALRGGGGNFGVVTSFLFRLHPVSTVFAGPIAWDQKHARTIMQRYREFIPRAPEELAIALHNGAGVPLIPGDRPSEDHFDRVELEQKTGDNAEIAAAAAQRPEQ